MADCMCLRGGGSCVGYPPPPLSLCYSTWSRMLAIWQERCRSTPLVSSSMRHSHVVPSAFTVWTRGVQHCAGGGGGAIAHTAHMLRITAHMLRITVTIGGSDFNRPSPPLFRVPLICCSHSPVLVVAAIHPYPHSTGSGLAGLFACPGCRNRRRLLSGGMASIYHIASAVGRRISAHYHR